MDFEKKKKAVANRTISRAQSTLYFLEEFLRDKQGGTDAAYSRSLYILLSYSFELILKSLMVLTSNATSIQALDKELRKPLHDFEGIFKKLNKVGLLNVGLKNIVRKQRRSFIEYIVETDDNKILIQDFTNVRYDFISDDLRDPDANEMNRIKIEIKSLLTVTKKIFSLSV